VSEEEVRLILGENAVRCYGLDRSSLVKIAEKIGPSPEDIFGEYEVSPELISDFGLRGGLR
jgi:hypothetical protein